jgi:[acyl-carrier-protein] S-malonyltransferase
MHKVGLVFSGQGAQYVGMGRDLHSNFQTVKDFFVEAQEVLGFDIASLCFDGPQEELNLTENTQITILVANIAAYKVFKEEVGVKPIAMAGLSLGEYGALYVAEAIDLADVLELVYARGKYHKEALAKGTGCMAAIIGLNKGQVETICHDISEDDGLVSAAIFNTEQQIVISGHSAAVEKAMTRAKMDGAKRVTKLSVSVPCHCSLLNKAADMFEANLRQVELRDCEIPVIPNSNPEMFHSKDTTRELLRKQISSPVRWQETIEKMVEMGIDTIVEIGPKRVLSGLVRRINRNIKLLNVEDTASLEKTAHFFNSRQVVNGT